MVIRACGIYVRRASDQRIYVYNRIWQRADLMGNRSERMENRQKIGQIKSAPEARGKRLMAALFYAS